MTQFSIEPIYASTWLVVFAAVAIVGVIAWVAPPTTDPRKRRWLILLRSIAALVLLLAAVRPTIIRTDQRPSPATLVIAIDDSKSMSLPDGDGASRWDTQREAVQQLLDGLGNFDEAMDIELIRYDETSQSIGQATSVDQVASLKQSLSSQNPSGNTTDLGMAFSGAIDLTASKTLAGVVLIGDGMQTSRQAGPAAGSSGTSSPSNDSAGPLNARYGAQVLDALGVPLWTIPVGPPNTGAASRDVAVSNLPDSMQLFSGNQFELSFTVETLGLSGLQVPIQVTWIDEAGGREVSRTRTLDPSSARESMALDIPMVAPKPGVYRLEVEAERQDGEWVTSNNVQTAFVEVREGGGRILILEGPGRPELAFLRRSLRGFPDLDLQFATIRGDQSWPVQLEAALQPKRFDVLVIGDVDSSAFGDAQLKLIADRVSEGTGLITLGGLSSYSVGGYAGGPLDPVLPVKLDSSRRRQPTRTAMSPAERQARLQNQLTGPIKIKVAKNHPIVNLGGPESESVWSQLPALTGANRFDQAKPISGVQTLLESENDQPLLVIGNYGKGRVASLAIDETYRWWRIGKSEVHRRFWRQLMLWVMSREDDSGDSVIADLDHRRFESDQAPAFQARVQLLSEHESTIRLTASVVDENGETTELKVTENADSLPRISGQIPDLGPGFYKLRVEASDPSIKEDEVAFQVVETSRELTNPMADYVYMQQLADLTEQHGGASFDATRLEPLIETIVSKRRRAETTVIEKATLGDGPISGWIVFLLFATALSVEWWLRRQWQMA